MKKVKGFQSSDGQLFLDSGKLVTHELRQIIQSAVVQSSGKSAEETSENVAKALADKHTIVFDVLKLLRAPVKRKKTAAPAAAPTETPKRK